MLSYLWGQYILKITIGLKKLHVQCLILKNTGVVFGSLDSQNI